MFPLILTVNNPHFGVDPVKKCIFIFGISSYSRNPEPKEVLK